MNVPLFLFCGGPSIYGDGLPKPLMQISDGQSLIIFFLNYLKRHRLVMPTSITLLCDDGQEVVLKTELNGFSYPVPIRIQACGHQSSTFEKFEQALIEIKDSKAIVQFGYPDIFFLGEHSEPAKEVIESDFDVHISAASLTSRFPQLIVDVYTSEIKGISNYSSLVPSNPQNVFGGDLWGRVDELLTLIREFKLQGQIPDPSLEFDFFFWLINRKKMRCVMLYGERIWIDSIRDIHHLLARLGGNT